MACLLSEAAPGLMGSVVSVCPWGPVRRSGWHKARRSRCWIGGHFAVQILSKGSNGSSRPGPLAPPAPAPECKRSGWEEASAAPSYQARGRRHQKQPLPGRPPSCPLQTLQVGIQAEGEVRKGRGCRGGGGRAQFRQKSWPFSFALFLLWEGRPVWGGGRLRESKHLENLSVTIRGLAIPRINLAACGCIVVAQQFFPGEVIIAFSGAPGDFCHSPDVGAA